MKTADLWTASSRSTRRAILQHASGTLTWTGLWLCMRDCASLGLKEGNSIPSNAQLILRSPLTVSGSDTVEYAIRDSSRIAIVGNGPLSKACRKEIRGFEFVARFNKMDNFQPGDPLTLVYLRLDPSTMSFYGIDVALRYRAPAVALVYEQIYAEAAKEAGDFLRETTLLHVYEEFAGLPYPGDHLPYPPYADSDRIIPSTGFFGLHHIMKTCGALSVHLFGFTWEGWRWHDWDYEKSVIQKYAEERRVVVHSG